MPLVPNNIWTRSNNHNLQPKKEQFAQLYLSYSRLQGLIQGAPGRF